MASVEATATTLERFSRSVKERHEYARAWKERTGGKVVGYFCSYVPEEVLYAQGVLTVRVLGSHEPQDLTERHIFGMFCPYSRDVLFQGLSGRYDYLDGLVFAHCCPHIRQSYESWRLHRPVEFNHLMWVPSLVQSEHAVPFFEDGVRKLTSAAEEWTDNKVTPEALGQAISTYNLNRRLLAQLYEWRKPEPPLITGAQAMEVVVSSTVMDKAEHNQWLQELLASKPPASAGGVRLLALGSENDDTGIIELLESLGASVAIEDNCLGNRYFWDEVSPDGDGLQMVAARYLGKPPCPQRDIGPRVRANYLSALAKEYDVQGVVFLRQKFCDPHAYEVPILQQVFKDLGLPALILELDVTTPHGQYRTRIEAFMEMFV